ncbi:hypothetical protein [Aliiglaciecola sp. LCG003]|uniref:hypothetical protein n=1 Tax=Aliiglaciecola sp. LCG003 TaxID=3053655 RepID=UPI0025744C94|nr:hypothetical protein [Aliiglaciecola sp. LCG003]WJG08119.1 hypothetical protein QR722_12290 [Aliiglaciecola sp. LCG003]
MKGFIVVSGFSVFALSGCVLFDGVSDREPSSNQVEVELVAENFCLSQQTQQQIEHNCDVLYWLNYWVEQEQLSWPQRLDKLNELGDSPADLMKKVLLSQIKGTPYQHRLRAQGWAEQIFPQMSGPMRQLFRVILHKPSEELLELESGLTILTKLNTNQSKVLDEQKLRLQEQQQQIDQLLKIEASMMEKKEGINQ